MVQWLFRKVSELRNRFGKIKHGRNRSFGIAKKAFNKKVAIVLAIIAVAVAFPVFQYAQEQSEALVPLPTFSTLNPNSGLASGGETVEITGTNFLGTYKYSQISAGHTMNGQYSCAIADNGLAYCWGQGANGRLGNGSTDNKTAPTAVDTTGVLEGLAIKQISAGSSHTCAVASDGNAYCWGQNTYGQLGDGSTDDQTVPVAVDTSGLLSGLTIEQITVGNSSTCAIASNGQVYCWGYNYYGQLGNGLSGADNSSATPVAVLQGVIPAGSTSIKQIASGDSHYCVIASNGLAYCWGYGANGRLGNSSTTNQTAPVAVSTTGVLSGLAINQISIGASHSCAIASNDLAYCWGTGTNGQLGNGLSTQSNIPVAVSTTGVLSGLTIKQITAGGASTTGHTCVIASNDRSYCWGTGSNGRLGNGSITATNNTPVAVLQGGLPSLSIKQISAGYNHTCAIASDDQIYCWGSNAQGQLGNSAAASSQTTPMTTSVMTYDIVASVKFGNVEVADFTIDSDTQITVTTPAHAYGTVNITVTTVDEQIATLAGGYTYKLPAPTIDSITPNFGLTTGGETIEIAGADFIEKYQYNQISTGHATNGQYTCAIAFDEKAYCWGGGSNGRLGNGSTDNKDAPTAVDTTGVLKGLDIKQISTGTNHTCAIASDGNAYCWGQNNYGQLGNGLTDDQTVPVAVDTSGVLSGLTIKQISVGTSHTCAIASDDNVYCWGLGASGQLGNGLSNNSALPTAIAQGVRPAGSTIKQISAGDNHTCIIASNDLAYCWGQGTNGRLGNNLASNAYSPTAVITSGVLAGLTIKQIALGAAHSCVIASDDQAYCWGLGTNGMLGNGTSTQSGVPVAVSTTGVLSGLTIKQITAGGSSMNGHTCVIASNDQAYCWGTGTNGRLGNGSTITTNNTPVAVLQGGLPSLSIKQISAGYIQTCAIASDDQVYCWGANSQGQLGNSAVAANQTTPIATSVMAYDAIASIKFGGVEAKSFTVDSDGQITAVAPSHSYGTVDITITTTDGQVVTLQNGYTYKLPEPTITSINPNNGPTAGGTEVEITGTNFQADYIEISAGLYHTLAIDSSGNLWGWGRNNNYQAGDSSSTNNVQSPIQIMSGTKFIAVEAGQNHSFAIDSDGNLWAWGNGGSYRLGSGSITTQPTPIIIKSGTTFASVVAGPSHTLAIDTEGNLWGWGSNANYQATGANSTTNAATPTRIMSGTKFSSASTGYYHSLAIDFDGNLWAWGQNDYYQAGDSTNASAVPRPIQIMFGTRFKASSAGIEHTLAIDQEGNLWGWGNNSYYQAGDSTSANNVQSPIQIMSGTSFKAVSAGGNYSHALDVEGKLWGWGSNVGYAVGNGSSTTSVSVPVQISANKSFQALETSIGYNTLGGHGFAIDTEGNLLGWGYNAYYQIRDISTTNVPFPAQLEQVDLSNITRVTLSSSECINLIVISDTTATCTTPAHSAGDVDVVVTTVDGQTATLTDGYTYEDEFINLTLDTNNLEIEVTPNLNSSEGVVSSTKHTASFTTNIPGGVVLSVSTNTNHSNLVNLTDSTKTIEPTTGSLTALSPLSNNTWGFALADRTLESNNSSSSTTWASVPNTTQSPAILKTTTTPNPDTANTTDVFYGAKINANQQAGTYMTTVVYTAVARL